MKLTVIPPDPPQPKVLLELLDKEANWLITYVRRATTEGMNLDQTSFRTNLLKSLEERNTKYG